MELTWPFLRRHKPQLEEQYQAFQRGERGINKCDEKGNTLLHHAVFENRTDLLESLLAAGILTKTSNKLGMTPLDLARLLGRKAFLPSLEKKQSKSIRIFRNSDQKEHLISIDEFEEKLNITYLEHLEFETPESLLWTAEKSQKTLNKTTTRQMNRWVLALHEKKILNPSLDSIYVRYIDPYLGYGVFAARDIPALTYIGEYTGVVKKRKRRQVKFNDYVFGYMTGPKDSPFLIDAKEKGNFTRFINHSDSPNLASRWVVAGGVTRIIVFSNQLIPKDSQLTYDYGKYYWRSRSAPEQL